MALSRVQLLRNVGQFDSVNSGAQLPLAKLALIYAENGRGKTTLASILRSIATNDPQLIEERHRLGAPNRPHIVLDFGGAPSVFQNGVWSAPVSNLVVFDDGFVAANVCSGIEVEAGHRQRLHELILGSPGVALHAALQLHVERIEEHNRTLRLKEGAISAAARGALSVDAFCALPADLEVDQKIAATERQLAAARSADAVRQRQNFAPLELPAFDIPSVQALLSRALPNLQAEAAARLREHLRKLGDRGEVWVAEGMGLVAGASAGSDRAVCPFCAQELQNSAVIEHYQEYFSEAYDELKSAIRVASSDIARAHGGEVVAGFERAVRVAVEGREFWRAFTEVPGVTLDTAAIARSWAAARDAILSALQSKATNPLEPSSLTPDAVAAVDGYHRHSQTVDALSSALQACNAPIAIVKEQAASANASALAADLSRLNAVRIRHSEEMVALCADYLAEKAAKAATENQRTQARDALDNYRRQIFPTYEAAINEYLQRFNAGFRIGSVASVNSRGGSSCTYNVVINNVPVSLNADAGPSFRNTLSAGDRNTLALAFFFSALEQDPQLANKIVVVDDPMTSLDEHRSLTTVQEMHRLVGRVNQAVVLSHSKPFLCALWDGADKNNRSAMFLQRSAAGSVLASWDVRQDCVTEHDRRHMLVAAYLNVSDPAKERQVAAALRPILEAFIRVAYPDAFPPGSLLGPFINTCEQRLAATPLLDHADIFELRALLDYANRFHHDTNPAWETAYINDQELIHFSRRALNFTRRA